METGILKIKDFLDKNFSYIEEGVGDREFCLYLSEYIDFVDSDPILIEIMRAAKQKKQKSHIALSLYDDYVFLSEQSKRKDNYSSEIEPHLRMIDLHRKLSLALGKWELAQENSSVSKVENDSNLPVYNFEMSILFFRGKRIKIGRGRRLTNQAILMEYLFGAPLGDEVDFSDILINGMGEDSHKWEKCYSACREIQSKILKETKIGDFLIYSSSRGSVKVNPIYTSPHLPAS